VPGTAVFLTSTQNRVPHALLHNLKHNKVLHERVIFLTLMTRDSPFVAPEHRAEVTALADGFWRVVARYGYMEHPRVEDALEAAAGRGLPFHEAETSYFVGRETVIASSKPGMSLWRERLFGLMMRNAQPFSAYLGLRPNRVVELGAQVEI
jgi:KUP system potassium uptake protein